MKCYICDVQLSDDEIRWDNLHQDWAPCTVCKEVVAAVFGDEGDDENETELSDEEDEGLVFDDEDYA